MLRVVFMGTPDFAVPCLEKLCAFGYDVCAVFTNPDKPKGRKHEVTMSPVKEKALRLGLDVYQPRGLADGGVYDVITKLAPDVVVVVAYGKILPENILNVPKYGCVNVHGSLLPKYRGAAPIQWALINGEKVTGVTTMYMDSGLDTGDIIFKREIPICIDDTAGDLFDKLSVVGADLLIHTLEAIENGTAPREAQDKGLVSYAKALSRSVSRIDWSMRAQQIHDFVRGMNPWPGAMTTLCNNEVKIHKTRVVGRCKEKVGLVCGTDPFIVACGSGTLLEIIQIQQIGKKKMLAVEFARGLRIEEGKEYYFE